LGVKFGTIINLEKNVVFQQLPHGGTALFWRHAVLPLYLLSALVRYPDRGIRRLRELVGMSIKDVTLDPELADLIRAAFDKSWRFVKTDPELAHADTDQKRTQLSRHLTHLAQSRERDLWRLANKAIGGLRRERTQPN
jgi:hypothetical protein